MRHASFTAWLGLASVLAAGCVLTPQPQPPGLDHDAASDAALDPQWDVTADTSVDQALDVPSDGSPDVLTDIVGEITEDPVDEADVAMDPAHEDATDMDSGEEADGDDIDDAQDGFVDA